MQPDQDSFLEGEAPRLPRQGNAVAFEFFAQLHKARARVREFLKKYFCRQNHNHQDNLFGDKVSLPTAPSHKFDSDSDQESKFDNLACKRQPDIPRWCQLIYKKPPVVVCSEYQKLFEESAAAREAWSKLQAEICWAQLVPKETADELLRLQAKYARAYTLLQKHLSTCGRCGPMSKIA